MINTVTVLKWPPGGGVVTVIQVALTETCNELNCYMILLL